MAAAGQTANLGYVEFCSAAGRAMGAAGAGSVALVEAPDGIGGRGGGGRRGVHAALRHLRCRLRGGDRKRAAGCCGEPRAAAVAVKHMTYCQLSFPPGSSIAPSSCFEGAAETGGALDWRRSGEPHAAAVAGRLPVELVRQRGDSCAAGLIPCCCCELTPAHSNFR